MKPPVFKYHDPTSLEDALDLLAAYGDRAKVLAGGQSLMPLLNFRLARPEHLVDLNRIPGLADVSGTDGGVSLGAMVRQRTLEHSATVAAACPLLAQAMPFVGHPQIRNRGTLGGSLAHADPAAELPAVMLALDAQFTLVSKQGRRVMAASDFFVGNLTTALQPDEMLVRIELPVVSERTGSCIREVAMRAGDFALAGVVASVTLGTDGRISRSRIACFGVADRPLRVPAAEACLTGREPTDECFVEAGRILSAQLQCVEDIHASAAYRQRVAGILTTRALAASMSTIT